jgi:hypothetical protein
MSRERTSVVGTVILTSCVTSIVILGAGWFAWSQYVNQQTAKPSPEVVATPAPKRKSARPPKNTGAQSGPQDGVASGDPAPGGPEAAENDSARRDDNESSNAAGRGTPAAPTSEADAARARDESESSGAAPQVAVAAPSAETHDDARTIMVEAQRRSEASSYQYEGLLEAFDAKGKVTEKRWTFERQGSHGQSKAVLRFTAPAEVKGVALLIFNHPDRASDQWMWTPALERDRRIALQDRSTRFFGTDFSFEDLEERDVDQYDYSMLGSDASFGTECWKIQSIPKKTRSSQYSRSTIWIRKDNYAPARLDNFVGDEVVRRLTYSSIENIQGIWTARQVEVAELHRGTRTRLTIQQVKYNTPMKGEDFTLQAIRRQ